MSWTTPAIIDISTPSSLFPLTHLKKCTETDTASTPSTLPWEVLLLIRSILTENSQMGSGAKLVQCSRSFYDIFIPVLRYDKLILRGGRRGNGVFEGLMGRKCYLSSSLSVDSRFVNFTLIYLALILIYKFSVRSNEHHAFSKYLFPTSSTHFRKLSLLQQCTHLTIHDLPSAISIISAQEAIGEATTLLFPNIQQITFGSELILSLALELDISGIERIHMLSQIIKPKDICMWFPSPSSRPLPIPSADYPYQDQQDRPMEVNHFIDIDDMNYPSSEHHTNRSGISNEPEFRANIDEYPFYELINYDAALLYNKSRSLQTFLSSFLNTNNITNKDNIDDDANGIENIIIHNITFQSIPSISHSSSSSSFIKAYRLFFADHCSCWKYDDYPFWENLMVDSESLYRAVTIVESLPWKSPINNMKYIFVNAELNYLEDQATSLQSEDEFLASEKEDGKVERLVRGMITSQGWSAEAIEALTFTRQDRVEPCICCEGK
ncbi:uncharacterized protein IL334_004798 [Kwoniella shivajii]|uniref:F-box domain-containing protein n=1 Tax=Kwoniella shivajii TaxID=564305 RepID=A0ABZ1D1C5_9TREE|nr:hypothetical protein IL334_004798 [Kwoniella shivajii]